MPEFFPLTERILGLDLPWKLVGPFGFPITVWLVQDADRWVLIDTGGQSRARELVAAVEAATRGIGPEQVLLTHGHADHVGGLSAVLDAWDVSVFCHVQETAFLRGTRTYADQPSRSLSFTLFRRAVPTLAVPSAQLETLDDGARVAGMKVIHLPGHAPGQIGFLHTQERALICGDAVMNLRGRLSGPLAIATPDPATARRSMARLLSFNFDRLLPSHGRPLLQEGRAALARYLTKDVARV